MYGKFVKFVWPCEAPLPGMESSRMLTQFRLDRLETSRVICRRVHAAEICELSIQLAKEIIHE